VTYIQNSQAWDTQPHPAITDSEPDAFVVSKLAELVVVLFRDHVPREGSGLRERAEGRAVLLALGDTAADHGRPDLIPILHRLAKMVETPEARFKPLRTTGTLTYHF